MKINKVFTTAILKIWLPILFISTVIVSCTESVSSQKVDDHSGSKVNEISGPELGSNFNHNPEIIDFYYLQKAGVSWVRTTPRIFDYIDGRLKVEADPGIEKVIEAGQRGYKVAFGFRWDFRRHKRNIPEPGSADEERYFEYARRILKRVGPHVDIFKLGNEPILETLPTDMEVKENGIIPLVRFTRRLLTLVVEPYYKDHPGHSRPDIYVGSIHALFSREVQEVPATDGLIRYAQESDAIQGLSLHLHISDTSEIEDAFVYARNIIPEKPIIIPEFSLHRLYVSKLSEPIGINEAGEAFAQKYGRDPEWKLYQWYSHANTNRVSRQEWLDFFNSRDWYPRHFLNTYFRAYRKYGVVLATYPLLQQYCPDKVNANSAAWFINPIFCQKSLELDGQGNYSSNPLNFDDFVGIVEENN